MEILEIKEIRESISPVYETEIQEGRWYHMSRVMIVKSDTKVAVVSMNIFERALAILLSAFCIDYALFKVNKLIDSMECEKLTCAAQVVLSSESHSRVKSQLSHIEIPRPISPSQVAIRPVYPSFASYRQEREAKGESVDLIVGRGTINPRYVNPTLKDHRYFQGKKYSYQPFTIDCDPNTLPDFKADVTKPKTMASFPDQSVDEIYLERLFPPNFLYDVGLFYNAARILKVEGILIADFNDGMKSNEVREKQLTPIRAVIEELNLPLIITTSLDNKYSRNDIQGSQQFVCIKYGEVGPEFSELLKDNRLLKASNRIKDLLRQSDR